MPILNSGIVKAYRYNAVSPVRYSIGQASAQTIQLPFLLHTAPARH